MAGHVGAVVAASKERQNARITEISMVKLDTEIRKEKIRATWPPIRRFLHNVIHTTPFEIMCTSVILANMCLVIVETDDQANGDESPAWVEIATSLCMLFYIIELIAKFYCYRLEFFQEMWNNLDLAIVSFDLCLLVMGVVLDNLPSVSVLRVFRLARLARAVQAMHAFQELNSLIKSFMAAIRALFWGMLMVAVAIIIWSILAVQLLHPINERVAKKKPPDYEDCERCPRSFASVWDAALTWWKLLVAGDSWGPVCEPIITEAPWTCVFFFFAIVTVNLILLNLILAVIVEAGAATAAANEHKEALGKQVKIARAEEKLIDLCRSLDSDKSGSLSITEFMSGYSSDSQFKQCLQLMNVTEADMSMLFSICDEDDSGEVDYQEFVDQIRRIKHSGQQMVLHYITQIRHMIHQNKKLHELHRFQKTQKKREGGGSVKEPHGGRQTSKGSAAPAQGTPSSGIPKDEAIAAVPPILPGNAFAMPPEENAVQPTQSSKVAEVAEVGVGSTIKVAEVAEVGVVDRFSDDKMNMLMRMNEDLVSAMTDVAQESKAQSQLLKTLVEDSLAQNRPAGSLESRTPTVEPKFNNGDPPTSHRSVYCKPWDQAVVRTENSGVAPRSGPTVPASSFASPTSCCAKAV